MKSTEQRIIHPTGTCFDDAIAIMEQIIVAASCRVPELFLCHAIIKESGSGKDISHAWVELGDVVLLLGFENGKRGLYAVRKEQYYADCHVRNLTRYTPPQVLEENLKHETNGPWKPEYLSLCRKPKLLETT